MISPCWFCRKINESGSNSRVVPYHASRFGRSSSVGSNRSRVSRSERAVGAVGGHDQVRIDQLARVVDSTVELEADTGLAAMTMQGAKEIDPGHAMEGVAGEGYVLALVHDLHVVEDDLPGGDGIVDLGGDLADERERDVGEHESPAVGGALRIPLVDAYVVARFGASHQVREEEPCRPSTDDSNLHGFARAVVELGNIPPDLSLMFGDVMHEKVVDHE